MRNSYLDERLKALCKNKGIEASGTEIARLMKDRGIDVIDDVNNAARTINLHLSGKPVETLSGVWLIRYCKFFSCSADYLLGFIDTPTHKIASVCKNTGLSADAAETLIFFNGGKRYQENEAVTISERNILQAKAKANRYTEIINRLLECDLLPQLLDCFHQGFAASGQQDVPVNNDNDPDFIDKARRYGFVPFSKKRLLKMWKQESGLTIQKMFESIVG